MPSTAKIVAPVADEREDQQLPDAFSRAAAQVEQLTRNGLDRARHVSQNVKEQALRAGDSTVGYIKDEPVKAVLIAAAAGAALALLVRALSNNARRS
jgi:ElaB/YqjD/DUF883 family membrane-anchored ribosome-binding protein